MQLIRAVGRVTILLCVLLAGSAAVAAEAEVATEIANLAPAQELYPMEFPLDGSHSFTDTFGAPREGNRLHQGIDIFAEKLTPVVAVADGTVTRVATGDRAGRYIVVQHNDQWLSYYLHLNNDTPGTDDGLADDWVEGIVVGAKVKAGDLLDYVGDSGNAESTPSHLHFELHRPAGVVVNPYPHLLAADGAPDNRVKTALENTDEFLAMTGATALVGQYEPGEGFAAGLWVHDEVAYLGTWGRPQACPGSGVRMIDVADPSLPESIGSLATGEEFQDTDTDSVWAGTINTDTFTGNIAVVAVSLCDNSERSRREEDFRGLAIYDVSDPAGPELLSTFHSGEWSQGVHELDVAMRGDGRVLLAAAVMQSYPHTEGVRGDVRILDITNPYHPLEIADWDFRRDAALADADELQATNDEEQLHAHSVSFAAEGRRLWVASWDAGAVLLGVDDPTTPVLAAWVAEVASAEGNVHSAVSDAGEGLLVLSSEDLYPTEDGEHESGWGHQAIFDLTGRLLSRFAPDNVAIGEDSPVPLDGYYTAHNGVLNDDRLYSAWYSNGVRIVDLSNPSEPNEIGYFVPPPAVDPQGYWVAPDDTTRFAMVWDVFVEDDLIYVSDMNSGLWIVRYIGDDLAEYEPY